MPSVKEIFLQLTNTTIPSGQEKLVETMLPNGYKKDFHGNYYIKIGETTVMFASHCDTADSGQAKIVNHVFEGDMIKTDGKTILGADDKAGMAIMFKMIEKKVPGLYYFFLCEEHGCVGSKALNTYLDSHKDDPLYKNINKVISLDRKDYDNIITYQVGERCCSDEFANELANRLNSNGFKYRKDTTGAITDSHQVSEKFPECTNLSVGYFDQHSVRESQNIVFLNKLADACCSIDWETLPVKRDPSKVESLYGRSSSYYGGGGSSYRSEWTNNDWWSNNNRSTSSRYNASASGPSNLQKNQEYINDYLGRKAKVANCVWCEYDKVWCPKDEAIWVDYIGFYTCPDYDPTKVKMEPLINLDDTSNDDFKNLAERDLKAGLELYKGGKLFGTIESIDLKKNLVIIHTENKSKFICPPDKIISTYNLQIKNEIGVKKLTKTDVKEGLEVFHSLFGKGKIIGFRPDKTIIKVNFKDKGEKDLHIEVANLKF